MENRARRVPSIMARVSRQGLTLIQRLFEPSAAAGGKQRWYRMLLSAFLLLIAINTFIGMVVMKNAGNSSWVIMLATGAILTLGYVLNRTIYYRLATVIAVSIPAVPIIAMVLFSPNRDVIPYQLPWLALPLLACSLVLSLHRTVIIATCYAALILLFIPLVKVPIADLTQTLAFMFMIIFFVVAVTAANQQGQAEIEHQFAERQAAETALRESEDKFSKAFHASPAVMSISTLKEGRIIEVNDSFTQISGYTREEVIGHSTIELGMHTNPADREKIAQAMEKDGTIRNIEIELSKKSGETHCVLFSAEPVNIGGEPCILGVSTDITEQKRAEESLRKSEEKFSKAFRASPEMISITSLKDDRFIEVNDTFLHQVGLNRDEVIGHSADDIKIQLRDADHDRITQLMEKQGSVHNEEVKSVTKTGEERFMLFSAEVIEIGDEPCIIVLTNDITEQKRAEESLRKSEEQFRRSLDDSPMGIRIINAEGDETVYANKAILDLYGYDSLKELKETPAEQRYTPQSYAEYRASREKRKRSSKDAPLRYELSIVRKDGEIRELEAVVKEMLWDGKKHSQVIYNDITERKRAEMELVTAQGKLKEAQRLAHIGTWDLVIETDNVTWSEELYRIVGWDPSRPTPPSSELQHLYTPDSWNRLNSAITKAHATGEPYELELEIIRPDGITRWVNEFGGVMRDGNGDIIGFHGTLQDITERKVAEVALSFKNTLFDALLETTIDGIMVVDENESTIVNNKRFLEINRIPQEWLDSGDDARVLQQIASMVEDPEMLAKKINYLSTHKEEKSRDKIRFKDGTICDRYSSPLIDAKGVYLGRIWFIRDITAQEQAEEAIMFKGTILEALAEVTLDALLVVDENDKILLHNKRFQEMGNIPTELLEARDDTRVLSLFVSQMTNPKTFAKKVKYLYKHKEAKSYDEMSRKDGKVFDRYSSPMIDANGIYRGRIWFFRDITERRRSEEALRESEEKFSKAFRSSPDAIVISALKDGKFIEVNDSFTRFIGYTREELIGRSSTEFETWASPDDRARMLQVLKEKGRVFNEEYEFRRKSGEIRTWLFSAELIDIGGKPCLLSVNTDITEQRQMEAALRESEEKYRNLFEHARDAVILADVQTGTIIDVNPSGCTLLGLPKEKIVGMHQTELHPPEMVEKYKEMFRAHTEKGVAITDDVFIQRADGTRVPVDLSASVAELTGKSIIQGVFRDITERKRAEEALRESEEKYRAIFEQGADSIVIIDEEPMRIVDFNDKAHENLGYTRKEFAKIDLGKINANGSVEKVRQNINEIHEKGMLVFEEKQFTKTGEIRDVLISSKSINTGGRWLQMGIWHDITEQKQAEEKLKQALSELEQSSARLAATNKELEAFSYSVSHDLRSPLRSIDGFSQALLEDYSNKIDENGRDYLGRLRGASQKMGELIDGLLKLSRLTRSEMHKEPVDLSALAEEIAARFKETQPERQVKFVIEKGLTANGDLQLLRVLIENLLGNAWKFAGKTPHAKIEFGSSRNNGKKAYFIKDNGAGFDMTYVDKLFGAFQRLHDVSEFPGTGIGLATVQRIINRHGGNIWAEGAVDKGATFYFTLN